MSLEANFSLHLGKLDLEIDLNAPAGVVTAVLGPNGAGKTSLLRAIAGGIAIDDGAIVLDGTILDEPPKTFVAPEHRHIGMVHQEALLFPHLSALDNVAFAPRARGMRTKSARLQATTLLERVGVATHGDSKPNELSGGQAQRVALARALACDPSVLLLDEPLVSLDAVTRIEVRRDLRNFLTDFVGPSILVTHDPIDVFALADQVIILESGRCSQSGTIAEVTTRPRSRYVADLIGTNLIYGTARGMTLTADGGNEFAIADSHQGPVFATIAPSAIALHRQDPGGTPRNRQRSPIEHLDQLGDRVRVHLGAPLGLVAEITASANTELGLREGDPVWATIKATEIAVYSR